jgi:hypothetical protein
VSNSPNAVGIGTRAASRTVLFPWLVTAVLLPPVDASKRRAMLPVSLGLGTG